jgi:hypothetical protein
VKKKPKREKPTETFSDSFPLGPAIKVNPSLTIPVASRRYGAEALAAGEQAVEIRKALLDELLTFAVALLQRDDDPVDVLRKRVIAGWRAEIRRLQDDSETSALAAEIRRYAKEESGSSKEAFAVLAKRHGISVHKLRKQIERLRERKLSAFGGAFDVPGIDPRKRRRKTSATRPNVSETGSTLPLGDTQRREGDATRGKANLNRGRRRAGAAPPSDAPKPSLERRRSGLHQAGPEPLRVQAGRSREVDRVPAPPLHGRRRPRGVKRRRR